MLFSLVKKKKKIKKMQTHQNQKPNKTPICLVLGKSNSVIIVVQWLHYPHTFPRISDSIRVLYLSQRDGGLHEVSAFFLGFFSFHCVDLCWLKESLNAVALQKVSTLCLVMSWCMKWRTQSTHQCLSYCLVEFIYPSWMPVWSCGRNGCLQMAHGKPEC